jgi:hypothetical protein
MSKLPRLTILSVLLLAPVAAVAQGGPPPGVTWQSGPGGQVAVRHVGGQHHGVEVRHRRLQRGHIIPPFWFGPQFHISNWGHYGFADPGADRRWVRYYDDAYLIDRRGRVMDGRHGLDWDQYGERWEVRDGIPAYHGSNEYHPGDVDYAWAREQGGWGRGPGPHGYAYGHGAPYGGYGYYAYPIIIETTVTRPVQAYTTEIVEEVVTTRHRPRHRAARHAVPPRPACDCPAPRPSPPAPPAAPPPPPVPAGERG